MAAFYEARTAGGLLLFRLRPDGHGGVLFEPLRDRAVLVSYSDMESVADGLEKVLESADPTEVEDGSDPARLRVTVVKQYDIKVPGQFLSDLNDRMAKQDEDYRDIELDLEELVSGEKPYQTDVTWSEVTDKDWDDNDLPDLHCLGDQPVGYPVDGLTCANE